MKTKTSCTYLTILYPEFLPKTSPPKKEGKKYITGGYPPTWVEVWLPNIGWTILEPTNGRIYSNYCVDYDSYATEKEFNEYVDECAVSSYYTARCRLF